MKAYRGRRGIAPVILYLSTRWKCVQVVNFMSQLFSPRERTLVPQPFVYFEQEKNLLLPPGSKPHTIQPLGQSLLSQLIIT
jgi:hypothetical protein